MRLKVNNTNEFNLTLDLNVDYENERITVVVHFWNKMQHQTTTWEYAASEFDQALATYRQLEEAHFGGK